jgi:murein DD-endopeptidase MepM/ murein hydrolase activator NlpD
MRRSSSSALFCVAMAAAACVSTAPASPPAATRRERAHSPPEAAVQLQLRLPVDGTWIVIQGYRSDDSHRGNAAYALDLVAVDDEGRAHRRDGRQAQDWYTFGADVLASADGVVVRARDHVPDNRVWGKAKDTNTVIIQHGELFSEYVHLQRGSLRVRVGDAVTRGQVLARCGNSGAETPHLHWALLSSVEPIRTRPATLARYEVRDANGVWRAASGIPEAGETIRHPKD